MLRKLLLLVTLSAALPAAAHATPVSVYGAWLCGNDACTWASVRDMTDFDARNRWLINRCDGVPCGMTPEVVNYFKSRRVRVMLSIGGITYVDPWNQALAANATQLGLNAAQVAQSLGVGIEIDYEENTNPNLAALQSFINAYRSVHPYDATGANHAARLTIDLAAGGRRP